MRALTFISVLALGIGGAAAVSAQSNSASIRVQPGFFCAQNKCVRFSRDLISVSIQGRRPVSVANYRLRINPVISGGTFREIFQLALRQTGAGSDR